MALTQGKLAYAVSMHYNGVQLIRFNTGVFNSIISVCVLGINDETKSVEIATTLFVS